MKNKGRKTLSLKAQAVSELILAMIMIVLFIGKMYENIFHSRALHNIINYGAPFIIIAISAVFVIAVKFRYQPNDELSRELMMKATDIAVRVELGTALLVGIIMHLHGNHRHFEYYSLTGGDVCMFGVFLCEVFLAAKSIAFLWLDRTPKAEEEE